MYWYRQIKLGESPRRSTEGLLTQIREPSHGFFAEMEVSLGSPDLQCDSAERKDAMAPFRVLSFQSTPRARSRVPLPHNAGSSFQAEKLFYPFLTGKRQSQNHWGAYRRGSYVVITPKNHHLHLKPGDVTSLCDFQFHRVSYKPIRDAQSCAGLSHAQPRTLRGEQCVQISPRREEGKEERQASLLQNLFKTATY